MLLFRKSLVLLLCLLAPALQARDLKIDDLSRLADVDDIQVSSDGLRVAYVVGTIDAGADKRNRQVWSVDWSGGVPVQLTRGEQSASTPRWSPDGQSLAFLREGPKAERGDQVWLLDRRGGEAAMLTDLEGGVSDFAWSPDGKRLALLHRPTPAPAKDADGEEIPRPVVIDRFQFKSDGDGYRQKQAARRIHLFDIASRQSTVLNAGAESDEEAPTWSPDGTRIAFLGNRDKDADRSDSSKLYVSDARAGATPRQLTDFPGRGSDGPLAWSPDGTRIAFVRGDVPKYWLYSQPRLAVVPVAGGEAQVQVLTEALDRDVSDPVFSADGRSIDVLVTDTRNRYRLRVSAADGKTQPLSAADGVISAVHSGGGHTAVLFSHDDRPNEVYAIASGKLRALTAHNAALLAEVTLARSEDIQFTASDGVEVHGLLTRPPGKSGARGLPTVLWIHGGPYGQDEHVFDTERQVFAANGYAVLQINYRGGNGRGRAFGRGIHGAWGTRDVADLLEGVDHVVASGVADPKRLVVGGWSQGGILTNYLIATDTRFRAASSGAGAGNHISLYGSDQYVYGYEQEFGTPWKNTETWLKMSRPFFQADRIRTPTLYVGGLADFNVPIVGGEQMYQALQSQGVPTQLVIYPGEHHGISRPSFVRDLFTRYLDWFGKHLGTGLPTAAR
ncbi:S9 family peptidase [Luteimonas sp. RIT-PG2_3]